MFLASDTEFTSNGLCILPVTSAKITRTEEECYIEIEASEEYRDYLVQNNIIALDTLQGLMAFQINNPESDGRAISITANLFFEESRKIPTDRGLNLEEEFNIRNINIQENWDDVVTILHAFHKEEHVITVTSDIHYNKVYEKEIEFELSEDLKEQEEEKEKELEQAEKEKETLEENVKKLEVKKDTFTVTITELEAELKYLKEQFEKLGNSEAEQKEKLKITAEIPVIESELKKYVADRTGIDTIIQQTKEAFDLALANYNTLLLNYKEFIQSDILKQANTYLQENETPKINYSMDTAIHEILMVGDRVNFISQKKKINSFLNIIRYTYDCLTHRYTEIELGSSKKGLKNRIQEIESDIDKNEKKAVELLKAVGQYSSEYKRDEKELISRFTEDLYGSDGLLGIIQKSTSLIKQTAGSILLQVNKTLQDYSTTTEMQAAIELTAESITSTVNLKFQDYSTTKEMNSAIIQKADSILSTVNAKFTNYSTTTEMNSSIHQTAESITSTVNLKFQEYSTTKEMTSAITQKADSILSTVNVKFTNYSTTTEMNSAIHQTAESITSSVHLKFGDYSTTTQMNSAITQRADSIISTVNAKFTSYSTTTQMNSAINQSASSITSSVNQTLKSYSKTTEMNSAITQKADSITTSVNNILKSYSKTTEMNSAITQKADSITSNVNQLLKNYSTTTQMTSAINQSASSITTNVTKQINGVTQNVSKVEQTAEKINWIVSSGSSQSDFTLTDRVASLVSNKIDLTGYVTFRNLGMAGETEINASNIKTGKIDASRINVINLNADNITAGKLDISYLYSGTYKLISSGSGNTATIGGSYYTSINNVYIGASVFDVKSSSCTIGSSGGTLSFFGKGRISQRSVSKCSTSSTVTAQTVASKLNDLLSALNSYGLISSS